MVVLDGEMGLDGYIEEEDEDFECEEYELESYSSSSEDSKLENFNESSSSLEESDEEEILDKNGKRGECGATSDEDEILDKNGKRGECGATSDEEENNEEVDKRVAKKLKTILNTLELTPKTLKSKKQKMNRIFQQSKIQRLAKAGKNLFKINGASNIIDDSDSDADESN